METLLATAPAMSKIPLAAIGKEAPHSLEEEIGPTRSPRARSM
jgi:hypothetical protein